MLEITLLVIFKVICKHGVIRGPFWLFFYFVVNPNSSVCMIVISNITSLDGQISGSGYET